MEMTVEELKAELSPSIKEEVEKFYPEFQKQILESPEMLELLKAHKEQVILPEDKVNGEPVPFGQSAKFVRALMRKDRKTLIEIQDEEMPKYAEYFGVEEKTLSTYLTETDNAQGLYLCPYEWYAKLFEIPQAFGIARRDCLVIPMTTKIMYINSLSVRPSTSWIDAQVDLTYREKTVTKPKFDQVYLKPVVQNAIVVWEEELLADATPPLVQLITRLVATSFARGEDNALFNGNGGFGIGGIFNAAGIVPITMGAGDTDFSNIDANDLLDMIDKVDAMCSASTGKFYFHPNTLTHLRKLTNANGQYIWNAPAANAPGTIWGKPYETSCVLPDNGDSAPSTSFVVYGNLKEAVAFGDRQRLTIKLLTEATIDDISLAQYNLQALRFHERIDIKVVLPDLIAVLETAAM